MRRFLRSMLALLVFTTAAVHARGGITREPTAGTLRILGIGIDRYGFAEFRMSATDVAGTIGALRKGAKGLFAAVETTSLINAQATREGIIAAFEKLVAAARPEDTVVVHFAGLAAESADASDRGAVHLLSSDARPQDFRFAPMPTAAMGDARIPARQLAAWFSRMQARQQVLIFDTFTTTRGIDVLLRELNERDTMLGSVLGRGRLVVGLDGPTMEDPRIGHGWVTGSLLAGLGGKADLGEAPDGVITAWELEAALPRILHELANGRSRLRIQSVGADFAVAGATEKAAPTRGLARVEPAAKTEPPAQPRRKDYALLFASDVFDEGAWSKLANPIHDARTLKTELEDRYGFVVDLVENPTFQMMRDRLEASQQRPYGPEDQLLVFFAGHGAYDDLTREGFVIARDTGSGRTPIPALTNSQVRSAIDAIPCDHIMVIMDTCFGGTFDSAIAGHRGNSMYKDIDVGKQVERLLRYKSRVYLTSGGKEYVPDGRPGHHSPFVFKILEALRGGAGRPGLVLWSDLVAHVRGLPVEPKAGTFGAPDPGGNFVFVLREK